MNKKLPLAIAVAAGILSIGYYAGNQTKNNEAPAAQTQTDELESLKQRIAELELEKAQQQLSEGDIATPNGILTEEEIDDVMHVDVHQNQLTSARELMETVLGKEAADEVRDQQIGITGVALITRVIQQEENSIDKRIYAAWALREITGLPPTTEIASTVLDLAGVSSSTDSKMNALNTVEGAVKVDHIPMLLLLMESEDPQVGELTALRLEEQKEHPMVARFLEFQQQGNGF